MGPYVVLEKSLATDARVYAIASRLRNARVTLSSRDSKALALGFLFRFWSHVDEFIDENDVLPYSVEDIDEIVGCENFCSMLPKDWLVVLDSNHIHLPDYSAHSGSLARRRQLGKERARHYRNTHSVTKTVTPALRERPKTTPSDSDSDSDSKSKNKTAAASFDAAAVVGLDLKAWESWREYRKGNKPLKPASLAAAARQMAKLGDGQMAAVENSIANGYQGLIPPKVNGQYGKIAAPKPHANLEWGVLKDRAIAIGFRLPHAADTIDSYRTSLMLAERPESSSAPRARLNVTDLAAKLRNLP